MSNLRVNELESLATGRTVSVDNIDAGLRQDLANPDMGAAMVVRGVVAVDSITDLLALPEGQRKEGLRYLVKGYNASSDVGGGAFYWDTRDLSAEVADDPMKGIYVAPEGLDGSSGAFVRVVERSIITPEMFGAFGDGVSDDTESLVAAANKSAEYPLAMNGQYRKDVDTIIVLPSGARVEGTGTIKLLPHDATHYSIFQLEGVGDITIRGITVDGNRDENSSTGGEWGHGFYLRGTVGTVTLDSVAVIDCWGDGICVSRSGGRGCEHVEMINPYIRNCRRQGITIAAVDRLDIVGGLIEDINGTSPEAGMDFEPDFQTDKIRQVRVTGLEVRNVAGAGIMIHMGKVGITEEYTTDIEFTNLTLTGNRINVFGLHEMTKGRIFIDFTAKDLNDAAFHSQGVPWSSTLDMTLRPRIHNHNLGNFGVENPSSGWGCAFYMANPALDVDLRGPRIIDLIITEDEPRSKGITYSSGAFKDTQIINPIAAPVAHNNINSTSKYPYEAVKLVGDVDDLKSTYVAQNLTMTRADFAVGTIEFTGIIGVGTWTLPTGTVLGTNSVFIFTSGGQSLTIYPPSGGNFAGSDVDVPVVIPAQPGSGVKITPLGDDVFGAVTGFYTRN